MIPHIRQDEGQIGFYWVTPGGDPVTLSGLMDTDREPERLLPTHMSALDDALIDAVGRWGPVLGGGSAPSPSERAELTELTRAIDRLLHEYAEAERKAGVITETRSGQIAGTASLVGGCARQALGTFGPSPFDGSLDDPRTGVMSGHGQFHWVDQAEEWRGGRWLLAGLDDRRYPLTLETLLSGSGVEKDAAVKEHRDALRAVTAAAAGAPDPAAAARAVDYLLFDWLMANRESPSSAAIEIRSGDSGDAVMIVAAADAAAVARACSDPGRLQPGA